jgi:hypothetical protein
MLQRLCRSRIDFAFASSLRLRRPFPWWRAHANQFCGEGFALIFLSSFSSVEPMIQAIIV